MKKFLRVFRTEAEYLEYTASTEFNLNSVSRCREGSLVFYNPADCGGQGIHRTISGETYCDGYDKRIHVYRQVSYDDGVTWETTATTSSLVEKNSEDCGYVPPTPPSDWDITAKFNVTSTSSLTKIANATTGFSKIEIDGVEMSSRTGYTFSTTGEHTVRYMLTDPTSIGQYAFQYCSSLTSIDIPNSVTSISFGAFASCTSLTSITVNVTTPPTLGDSAFSNTNNCPIYVPCDSVDTYKAASVWSTYASRIEGRGDRTRTASGESYCNGYDKYVDVYGQVSHDCGNTWETTATTPTLVERNSEDCGFVNSVITYMASDKLYETTDSKSSGLHTNAFNVSIKSHTFSNGVGTITFNGVLTKVGGDAFNGCAITSVDIPDTVTIIGSAAFEYTKLTSIVIPSGVTSIGDYAFGYGVSTLKTITCNAMTAPAIGSYTFTSVGSYGTLYVPIGSTRYDVWLSARGLTTWTKVEQ